MFDGRANSVELTVDNGLIGLKVNGPRSEVAALEQTSNRFHRSRRNNLRLALFYFTKFIHLSQAAQAMMPPQIRPAAEADLPAVLAIYNHYVLHTVTSFLVQEADLAYVKAPFERAKARGLPYFVAEQEGEVIGYAYASPFRGFMLGYGHSVEITIFVHPLHTRKGLGGSMMKALLAALKTANHVSREAAHEDNPIEFAVWNVLAIMSIDDESEDGTFGMSLRDWYEKWGFQVVGRLEGIGWKQGRRLDTMYMQLRLQ